MTISKISIRKMKANFNLKIKIANFKRSIKILPISKESLNLLWRMYKNGNKNSELFMNQLKKQKWQDKPQING